MCRAMRRIAVVLGSALLGVWLASPAAAWVLYSTDGNDHCSMRWYGNNGQADAPVSVPISVDSRGMQGVSAKELYAVAETAAKQWNANHCGTAPADPRYVLSLAGMATPTAVGAGCKPDADGSTPAPCKTKVSNGNFVTVIRPGEIWPYGISIFALTVVTFDQCTGEIVDADVTLNDADLDFCTDFCKPGQQSLCNTLTHELGHVLGLDHSLALESTMDSSGPSGQTKKCTLHGDDLQGACAAYANGCGRGHVCGAKAAVAAPKQASGCTAGAAGAPSWPAWAAGLAWLLAIGRWRRPQRGKPWFAPNPCTSKSCTGRT